LANCARKHPSVIQGGSSVTHAFTNDWVCIVMRCPLTLFANARLTYEKTKGKLPSNKRHSSSLWKLIKISLRMVLIYFYLNCLYFHFTPWRCHQGISFISANKEFSMVCLNRAVLGSAIVGFHYWRWQLHLMGSCWSLIRTDSAYATRSTLTLQTIWEKIVCSTPLYYISMETVLLVYFCFEAKPANSKFATKTAKKNCEYCQSSQWNYQKKLKGLKFFRNFKF